MTNILEDFIFLFMFLGTQPVYKKSRKCVKINSENWKWFDDCCYYRPVAYVCKKLAEKNEQSYWSTTSNNIKSDNGNYLELLSLNLTLRETIS